jgi:WD40 repeat protein
VTRRLTATISLHLLLYTGVAVQLVTGSWAATQIQPEPPRSSPPLLRIEAGRHTGGILRISTDEHNRYLASVSLDKTVRIWDLPNLELRGVLRPPIGNGIKGTLYAVAMSPDGQAIACGGVEGEVLVFHRDTGRLIHRLQGLPTIITHLAYSRDGRWLVTTLGGQHGIRLYDTLTYSQVDQDHAYGAASHYAEFSNDGRLITVSDDGHLRLYELAANTPSPLKLIGKRKLAGDRPRSASFSPDGNKLAVGFVDHPRVDLVSGKDLTTLATLNTSKADDDQYFISVAWSGDGNSIYAAGSYQERGKTGQARGTTLIRRWTIGADQTFQDYPVSEGSIEQLLSLKNGDVVFATHDPALGVIDSSGARTQFLSRPIPDFRGMGEEFKISEDASTIRFAYDSGKSFAIFSLPARSFTHDPPPDLVLNSPYRGEGSFTMFGLFERDKKDLRITEWHDSPSPQLNGRPLALQPGELSRSVAIAPDQESFLLGTEPKLRFFARDGTPRWRISVPGIAWNVTISKNGRLAVAALGDGTIRWYRLQDGQELLALYAHTDRKRWIVWTPKGYFDADEDAEELIGWHLNRGSNREAEFYDASHFFEQFYHPELVARVLQTAEDDTAALQYFGQQERVNLAVGFTPPPTAIITTPALSAKLDQEEIDVTVTAEDQGGGIGEIRLYHNDKLVGADTRGIAVTADAGSRKQRTLPFHIRLVQGENDLKAVAISIDRIEGKSSELRITFKGPQKQAVLHLIAVGINQYQNSALNLNFAQPDAAGILKFFSSASSTLFRAVKITELFYSGATKSELLTKLQALKNTAPEDVVIVYLAGHGESVGADWYFLPHEVVYPERPEEVRQKGISSQEIKDLVVQIGAKKVLLLMDACKSGFALQAFSARGVDERQALAQLARANGVHIVAASMKDQFASEVQELGHGVFPLCQYQ